MGGEAKGNPRQKPSNPAPPPEGKQLRARTMAQQSIHPDSPSPPLFQKKFCAGVNYRWRHLAVRQHCLLQSTEETVIVASVAARHGATHSHRVQFPGPTSLGIADTFRPARQNTKAAVPRNKRPKPEPRLAADKRPTSHKTHR